MLASRMACTSSAGMMNPLRAMVTITSRMPRNPRSECRNRGTRPSKIPCKATAWMTARIRLTPRTTKLSARAKIRIGSRIRTMSLPHQQDDAESREQAGRDQKDRDVRQAQAAHARFPDAGGDRHGQQAADKDGAIRP